MTTKSGSGPSIACLCAAAIFSRLSFARRLALAIPMTPYAIGGEGFRVVGCCPLVACGSTVHSYSPECVEGELCEVRLYGVLRSWTSAFTRSRKYAPEIEPPGIQR